jgi:hypothetical protein
MRPSTSSIVVDVVISHHEGKAKVTNRDRQELLNHLTHALVNKATLKHHLDYLNKLKVYQNHPEVPTSLLNKVYLEGLDSANNTELAILCLDGHNLQSLCDAIDENMPECWHEAIRRENIKKMPIKRISK